MKFDTIVANPPFQDMVNRNTTPHKLWIDFTKKSFSDWLKDGGILIQVSPSSFASPSSKILKLFKAKKTIWIDFTTKKYFNVGSTFAHYAIVNSPDDGTPTEIINEDVLQINVDNYFLYIPSDICSTSLSIHNKVMFSTTDKQEVNHDYVTCHNITLGKTLSKERTDMFIYTTFHTNKQVWWTSLDQDCRTKSKVMWTRSGYTKPFFDEGYYGATDMAYWIYTDDGKGLAHNLNSKLMQYIFTTAKWSGFGNEIVFQSIPLLPTQACSDDELYEFFRLDESEVKYVESMAKGSRRNAAA